MEQPKNKIDKHQRAKRILYLSLERNIDLEKYHFVRYLDFNEITRLGYDGTMAFIKDFKPEIVIEREFADCKSLYDDLVLWIKREIQGVVTAIWMIDSHWLLSRHKELAKIYDFCFCSIFMAHQEIKKINPNTFWLPLCFPGKTSDIKRNKDKVLYDISFVGKFGDVYPNYSKRNGFLLEVKKKYKDKCHFVMDYVNMTKIVRASFVSLNYSLAGELNFRVFEILGNGSEIVCDFVPEMDLIYGLKERLFVFKDLSRAIEHIKNILSGKNEHDVIRNQIWVQNHHCLIHRHNSMLEMMSSGEQVEF